MSIPAAPVFEPRPILPPPPAPPTGLPNFPETPPMPTQGWPFEPPAPPAPKVKRTRLNLDSVWVLAFTVFIVFGLMAASFAASFAAILDVAANTGLPTEMLWVFPVFIDAAILAYTLSLFIFKHRTESTWRTLTGLFGFALLSIAANVTHTLTYWDGDVSSYQAWIGIVLTAAAPIAVLLASEEMGRLAFEPE